VRNRGREIGSSPHFPMVLSQIYDSGRNVYCQKSFIGRVPEHENGCEVDGVTEDLADGGFERQKEFLVGRVKVGLKSVEPRFLRTSYLVFELNRPLDDSPRPG
jgi:hypothetical protein